jgi:hypothetical protein
MFHIELRKFPHTVCRFNQSEVQLRAIVIPWAREEWIEEGEREWNMHEASLTVLEGPELSMAELSMGRGWRNAKRRSEDVTQRVLELARGAGADGAADAAGAGQAAQAGGDGAEASKVAGGVDAGSAGGEGDALLADSLGLELLARLDQGNLALGEVWRMAHARLGGGAVAGDSLVLAERALRSLLGRGLVVLQVEGDARDQDGGEAVGGTGEGLAGAQQETLLAAIDAWAGDPTKLLSIARKV